MEIVFTACCGKPVESRKEDTKSGYRLEGPVEHTGDTYCSRCKRDVTKVGNVRQTQRNKDIDQNGNWEYKLIKN